MYFDIAGNINVRYSLFVKHVTSVETQRDSASVAEGFSEACDSVRKGVLRSDVIECGVTTALVRLIAKCFNKPRRKRKSVCGTILFFIMT